MKTDVAIVGAGPAGMAAAKILAEAGLSVTVVDEQPRAGGQIYRQPPAPFNVSNWLPDGVYREGKQLLREVTEDPRIRWQTGTTVLGLNQEEPSGSGAQEHVLLLAVSGGVERLTARHVLIATGCYDMPVPMPGSTLPGVMAAGAIQAFIKSQQLIAGDRIVLAGTHPLQLIVAEQVVRAGGKVEAVLFAQSFAYLVRHILSSPAAVIGGGQLAHIVKVLWRLRCAGVPIRFAQTVVRANGEQALNSVTVAAVNAEGSTDGTKSYTLQCDRLGVCFGFLVSSELSRQAGVEHRWSDDGGGWISRCDEWMRTEQSGISVAGEVTGVAGAQVAAEEGRLAAMGILVALGHWNEPQAVRRASLVRRRLAKLNRFATFLRAVAAPSWQLLRHLLQPDALLCKCEEVTCGELQALLDANTSVRSANAAKLLSRIGMGLCQGRYCNYYLTRLLSEREQRGADAIGSFAAQIPVKPTRIGDLLRPS